MAGARTRPRPIGYPTGLRWQWEVATAHLEDLASAPAVLLSSPALILAGVGLLAWDYALLPDPALEQILYWVGLGAAYAGIVALGTVHRPGWPRQVLALALFGAVTWLPYLLRSPDRLLFVDERYHLDILQRALASGHMTGLDVRLFLLPGTFPGLEDATLALMAWTGLSPVVATRIVTLAIHAMIPTLAYAIARGLRIGRLGSFVAALIYAANTSFFFFHAVFSYESLGIVLFLSTWAVVALRTGRGSEPSTASGPEPPAVAGRRLPRDWPWLVLALPLVAGLAVTHHISSYLLVLTLAFAWVLLRLRRAQVAGFIGRLAVTAGACASLWFMVSRDRVEPYLVSTISDRVQTIVQTLLSEHAPRALFANSDVPFLERVVAFGYPPVLILLSIVGLVAAWRLRRRSPLLLPLAFAGPIAWIFTTPAVLTRSGELAYRAWPFLFVGVAAFGALGVLRVARWLSRGHRGAMAAVVFGTVGVLLMGGFSVGGNQAGRFPGQVPVTAAGSGNATDDAVAAALWLRDTAGVGHGVATDSGNATTFATDGGQVVLRWQSWYPFVVADRSQIVPFMATNNVDFLVVDSQITQLPPRYGKYFGEPDIPRDLDPGTPFPASLLERLDGLTGLARIYDSGRIAIYQRMTLPGDPGALP